MFIYFMRCAIIRGMNTTSRKDFTQIAFRVAQIATGDAPKPEPLSGKKADSSKGGKVGGKARADKLTPEQRSEIAQKAAQARWKK